MIWFNKINSLAFRDFLIANGTGAALRPGKPLDPFGSSMRKFNNAQSWVEQVASTASITLTTPRASDQAKIDLRGAHLLDLTKIELTSLGKNTKADWDKYGIPSGDADYEIPRCLALIKNAVQLNDELYIDYLSFWKELRQLVSLQHFLTIPELLYFFSFFNKEHLGYNPYLAIKGLKLKDSDFPTEIDWNVIKAYYGNPQVNIASDKYKSTLDGIVSRQGRTNFVLAMELFLNPGLCNSIISPLGLAVPVSTSIQNICNEIINSAIMSLNQILYGPPGTGKTHNAINHALSIINDKKVSDIIQEQIDDPKRRVEAKKQFDQLVTEGQIQFVTFHQSYSYEDFVEGIKSVVNANGDIEYRIEDGIFKKICLEAAKRKSPSLSFDDAYDSFIQEVNSKGTSFVLKTPSHSKPFNVKFNSAGSSIAVPQTKDATEMAITKNNLKIYVEQGIIKDWKPYTTAIGDYIKSTYISKSEPVDNSTKKFILIIDEINRGNISKIFGELITLIEKPKRLGEPEELRVKLTYSGAENKEGFGVPNNLYIIGTMNSADKSISLVDTALRRRFEFIEYTSNHELLSTDVEGINLQELLKTINSRIEILLDKDHKIGHAYLINVKSKAELCEVFRNRILPLLEEYFFGDYGKIQLVLGDNSEYYKQKDLRTVVENSSANQRNLFGKEIEGFEEKTIFQINEKIQQQKYGEVPVDFFKSIYTKGTAS